MMSAIITSMLGTSPNPAPSVASRRQVAFVTRHAHYPWLRQTEDGTGCHGGLDIRLVPAAGDDWIVVHDDINAPFETRVPLMRRIFFAFEPPEFKHYEANFINQFGVLVSPYPIPAFRGRWVQSSAGDQLALWPGVWTGWSSDQPRWACGSATHAGSRRQGEPDFRCLLDQIQATPPPPAVAPNRASQAGIPRLLRHLWPRVPTDQRQG